MSLISCATVGDPKLASARHAVIKTRNTYIQGLAAGAAIGGAVGGGAGAIIGNQSHRAGTGALVGAVGGAFIGGLAGLLVAQHVANQRQAYANAAGYITDCSRIAAEHHASNQRYLSALRERMSVIEHDRVKLKAEIAGSREVREHMKNEIVLQQEALRKAKSERVPDDLIGRHVTQIEALQADERNLTADIERLTAHDHTNALGSNP